MADNKHVIWSNYGLDIEDGWREAYAEFLEINNLGFDPEDEREIYDYMVDTNDEYLADERANLDIEVSRPIVAIADLGLWDGPAMGYKELGSCNIGECLQRMNDYDTWYLDEQGDLRCESVHHDGTNHVLYRAYREDVSEEQIEEFLDKVYRGTATQEDIEAVTRRLGDEIAKVYGWEIKALDQVIEGAYARSEEEKGSECAIEQTLGG